VRRNEPLLRTARQQQWAVQMALAEVRSRHRRARTGGCFSGLLLADDQRCKSVQSKRQITTPMEESLPKSGRATEVPRTARPTHWRISAGRSPRRTEHCSGEAPEAGWTNVGVFVGSRHDPLKVPTGVGSRAVFPRSRHVGHSTESASLAS